MEKYKRMKDIGCGSFGMVWKAKNRQTGELVAIKKLIKQSFNSMEECLKLREVKALRKMKDHPNIVKLIEIIKENDILYMVFEYMEHGNLYNLISRRGRAKNPFSETEIKNLCFQIFQGLAYMHGTAGYFHRDLKPENLLVSKNNVIKIADFGQAREIYETTPYTSYISTRWYRAPEVNLCAEVHGPSVDMWAMGAIMFELFTLGPMFRGDSWQEVMKSICIVIGSPTESIWSLGFEFAKEMYYEFPKYPGLDLSKLLPSASPEAVDLITKLVSWNPIMRPKVTEVLEHPFFKGCGCATTTTTTSTIASSSSSQMAMEFKQELLKRWESIQILSEIRSSLATTPKTEDLVRMLPENPFEFMQYNVARVY